MIFIDSKRREKSASKPKRDMTSTNIRAHRTRRHPSKVAASRTLEGTRTPQPSGPQVSKSAKSVPETAVSSASLDPRRDTVSHRFPIPEADRRLSIEAHQEPALKLTGIPHHN